jgi:hypothetical protein
MGAPRFRRFWVNNHGGDAVFARAQLLLPLFAVTSRFSTPRRSRQQQQQRRSLKMARGVIVIGDWGANVWEVIGIVIGGIVVLCCILGCIAHACGWKTEEEKAADAAAAQAELEAAQAAEVAGARTVDGVVMVASETARPIVGATPYMIVKDSGATV